MPFGTRPLCGNDIRVSGCRPLTYTKASTPKSQPDNLYKQSVCYFHINQERSVGKWVSFDLYIDIT